jgi:hypothetical protein
LKFFKFKVIPQTEPVSFIKQQIKKKLVSTVNKVHEFLKIKILTLEAQLVVNLIQSLDGLKGIGSLEIKKVKK